MTAFRVVVRTASARHSYTAIAVHCCDVIAAAVDHFWRVLCNGHHGEQAMNAAPKAPTAFTAFIPPRDFVAPPPRTQDRVTFNTPDDSVLAGFVAAIRHHLGNGQRFAWVELDNGLAGQFRGVPLVDIISSDDCGAARRLAASVNHARRLCLTDYSGTLADQLRAAGRT